jgi:hypothetical protein
LALFASVPVDAQVGAKAKQRILNQQQKKQQKQADAVDRFLAMSPQQRRKALDKLPPAQQRRILQRLNEVELLSDDERTLLQGRAQTLRAMAVERQRAVRAELQNLRKLPREDRRRRLGSEEFNQNFSENERQLFYDVFGQPGQQEE